MSFRWFPLDRPAGRPRKAAVKADSRTRHGRRPSALEFLEDRTLLSTSIPINSSTWTSIGPVGVNTAGFGGVWGTGGPASGSITGVAADPADPNTIFLATNGGGVWKTSNGSTTWTTTTDGQPTLAVGSVAVAPSNSQVIYAGTGDGRQAGQGVLKSTDGGTTWTLLGNGTFRGLSIDKIVVNPTNPNTVFAATAFDAAVPSIVGPGVTGVYKSTDGGATWTDTTNAIDQTNPWSDLVINPANPNILYAAVGTPTGAGTDGVYQSKDGGTTWALAGNFVASASNGRISLAISASNPNELLASVASTTSAGSGLKALYLTKDGGTTWNALSAVPNYLGTAGNGKNAVAIDPTNPNIFYAGGNTATSAVNGIVESNTAGASWNDFTVDGKGVEPHDGVSGFAFDATGHLLVGTGGGIWKLISAAPAGFRWADINTNLADVNMTGVALDPSNANNVYGAMAAEGISVFNDNAIWTMVQPGNGANVVVDPNNPQTVYSDLNTNAAGINLTRSNTGGANGTSIVNGITLTDPTVPIAPIAIDQSNPSHLLYGTNRIYTTANKGTNWTTLTTVNTAGWNSADPIQTIAIAPNNSNTIYAATRNAATNASKVFVSTDGGTTWVEHDIPQGGDSINQIFVDPANAQTAYAVRNAYNLGASTGHVYKTVNGGATWSDISGNLPNIPAWSVTVDDRNGRIYVGTDAGVFASNDAGATWAPFKTGLPNAQVTSLQLNPALNILLAGTYGRGAFEINPTNSLGVIPVAVQATEGVAISVTKPVAEFNDSTGLQAPSAYTATITWGDGTSSAASKIALLPDGNLGIFAPHTYAEEGKDTIFITVTSTSGISGQTGNQVTVGDAALTAVANPSPISATEGLVNSGVVGSFTDANPTAPLTDYAATINWGDGKSSAGTVGLGTAGRLTVTGTHTYAAVSNSDPISVTVTDVGGASPLTLTNTANVQDAPLTAITKSFTAVAGATFNTTIGSFTDLDPNAVPGNYTVTADYGDGKGVQALPAGSVVSRGSRFDVVTTYSYTRPGAKNVVVNVTDNGGATTTINSTATVSDAPITTDSASPVAATEGQQLSGQVAVFTTSNTSALATDYAATITWGDGTTGPGGIAAAGNGRFTVTGSHTYAEEGMFPFSVKIQAVGSTNSVTPSNTETVTDAPLAVSPGAPLSANAGQTVGGTIATFTDGNAQAPAADFASGAVVDWGDGSPTTVGTITPPSAAGQPYTVNASHKYANSAHYTVTVAVNDAGGSTAATSLQAVIDPGNFTLQASSLPTITEGGAYSGPVGLLVSGNPQAAAGDYIATIDWGDGTPPTQGTLTPQGGGGFTVSSPAGHAYGEEGTYTVNVSAYSIAGISHAAAGVITVTDAPIAAAPSALLQGVAGLTTSGVVAAFTEYANAPLSDFTATISWGDGHKSAGTVTQGPNGTFTVSGSNLYNVAGSYSPVVTVGDVGGSSATLTSGTVIESDPQISVAVNTLTAVRGRPFVGVLATVSEPNQAVTAGEFLATITWGDGSPDTTGTVTGSNGTFAVSGSHTYTATAASLPVTVTVLHLIGGSTATGTGSVHVLSLLTGAMSTASDTGPSNHDGYTRNTAPVFGGLADPGATVIVYAAPASSQSSKTQVGSASADATGHWGVQISPLADGVYAITASMIDPGTGLTAETIPVPAGTTGSGALVIATHGPTVSSVTLDPSTATLHVIFQTGVGSMYLGALMNKANYVFDVINSSGTLTPLTPVSLTPAVLSGGRVEANLRYNNGRALANAGYVVTLHAANLTDLAGNPLVETKLVTFPQTTNAPNPDYVAQINVASGRASAPFQYVSLAEQNAANNFARGKGKLVIRVPQKNGRPSVLSFSLR